jgi:antagonist of KipI
MGITIVKAGIQCSIQDLGRWGHQQFGVPVGGVMDRQSACTANRLCGNADGEALLECTLHGTLITCDETVTFALSGGGARAVVNGSVVDYNRPIRMVAGSQLQLMPDPHGCRTYIAVAGGLQVPLELGSASTYQPSRIGGLDGQPLAAGQFVPLKSSGGLLPGGRDIVIREDGFGMGNWKAQVQPMPHVKDTVVISCDAGPEWDWFDDSAKIDFTRETFTISTQSNRMGYRLEGPHLSLQEQKELVSTAVTRGIVQVTHEGRPIVLMADAQTIGGYPRIARLTNQSIDLLAQCRPGVKVRFEVLYSHKVK